MHVPKTAGMSLTRFLINATDDDMVVVAPDMEHSKRMAMNDEVAARLKCHVGLRHENPTQAMNFLLENGYAVPQFTFAFIRHPFQLMLSYYKHMRKPVTWKVRGMSEGQLSGPPLLAMNNSFEAFCEKADFYDLTDEQLAYYYEQDLFPNHHIVPLEKIETFLIDKFGFHNNLNIKNLEHRNKSSYVAQEKSKYLNTINFLEKKYPITTSIYSKALSEHH